MAFEIEFDPEAVKDLKKLDRPVQQRIVVRILRVGNRREIYR